MPIAFLTGQVQFDDFSGGRVQSAGLAADLR
jgi:hypothetical protein